MHALVMLRSFIHKNFDHHSLELKLFNKGRRRKFEAVKKFVFLQNNT